MKLIEYTCGLFPFEHYSYPEGEFIIPYSNKKYKLNSKLIVYLDYTLFTISKDLDEFYYSVMQNGNRLNSRHEYNPDLGILISFELFNDIIDKEVKLKNEKLKKQVLKLASTQMLISLEIIHEYDESQYKPLEYICKIRDKESIENISKLFFNIVRLFHDYILILRAPYVNLIDVTYLYTKDVYGYFCDETKCITQVNHYGFDFWQPKNDGIDILTKTFFDKNSEIPLEDLMIAKAKIYNRLSNFALAIIHIVIALDVIVPKYVNNHLKKNGVSKDAIEDFNTKFGLSVRVKTMLKLIMPENLHHLIANVGATIKHRNKIIHDGNGNEQLKSLKIDELLNDCEELIVNLKQLIDSDKK